MDAQTVEAPLYTCVFEKVVDKCCDLVVPSSNDLHAVLVPVVWPVASYSFTNLFLVSFMYHDS